jgi:putative endonuclease
MQKQYFIYILTNKTNTVLYTGVTNNLVRRLEEHHHPLPFSFTGRYKVTKLVYFEETTDINADIAREKQIKAGSRQKKIDLINSINPIWKDLASE